MKHGITCLALATAATGGAAMSGTAAHAAPATGPAFIRNLMGGDMLSGDQARLRADYPEGRLDQQWTMEPGTGGTVTLRNAQDGRCATAFPDSEGVPLIPCGDLAPLQKWTISPGLADGTITIASAGPSPMCLTMRYPGGPVGLADCNASPFQSWRVQDIP